MAFTNPKRFLPKSPAISADLRDRVIDLAKALEPFEMAAKDAFSKGPLERRELCELLEWNTVSGPMLARQVERCGRALYVEKRAVQRKADQHLSEASIQVCVKATCSLLNSFQEIGRWLFSDGRNLASYHLSEVKSYSNVLEERDFVARRGTESLARRAQSAGNLESAIRAGWFKANERVRILPRGPAEGSLNADEIFSLIRDMEFSDTSEDGIRILLPSLAIDGIPLTARLAQMPSENPFIHMLFFLNDEHGALLAAGALCRLTGEILIGGMSIIPARICFDDREVYETIRSEIFHAILAAVDAGALVEKEFVDLTPAEIAQLKRVVAHAADRPMARPTKTNGAATAKVETTEPPPELPPEPELAPRPPAELTPDEIAAIIEEMNRPRSDIERRDRIVARRSCMTWRQIMSALRRLGVEIDLTTRHPKLCFEGRKTGYVNSHEANERKVRHVLYRVLDDLGIDQPTFFANLF